MILKVSMKNFYLMYFNAIEVLKTWSFFLRVNWDKVCRCTEELSIGGNGWENCLVGNIYVIPLEGYLGEQKTQTPWRTRGYDFNLSSFP